LALVAGAVGFAPFNFPTAKVFLGDVGSYFAGAWIAGLVVVTLRLGVPPEAAVAPVALYAADTGATLFGRVRRGERWYTAHRLHAYQRLVDLGWSHSATTGFVFALIALCSTLGLISLTAALQWRIAADIGIAIVVATYLVSPTAVCRLRPRVGPGGT
jgi:UDP-N-acetylmuramyl pentapeptide phosphotransferase/UDP-N-acetylglucosamine-1-phosphate transferase